MNLLRAVSAGTDFPTSHFDGCVHSVFGSAANLRLRDGRLVTLLTAAHDNQPRAARIDTPENFRFDHPLYPGQEAASRAGVLRFSGAAHQIDLRGARRWNADLHSLELRREALDDAGLRIAQGELARHPGAALGIAAAAFDFDVKMTPLAQAAAGPIAALSEAAHRLDRPTATAAAARLVGLGPGLTPSGDDFLVGFMAGLWAMALRDDAQMRFVRVLGAEIARLSIHTADISQGFLVDAAQGRASESLIRLIERLDAGDRPGVLIAARRTLDCGSTSGADTLAGLLTALRKHRGDHDFKRGIYEHQTALHPESLPGFGLADAVLGPGGGAAGCGARLGGDGDREQPQPAGRGQPDRAGRAGQPQ